MHCFWANGESGLTFVESHRESHLRKHEKAAGGGAD